MKPINEKSAFAQRISELRKKTGLNQYDFAEMLEVHDNTIKNWENDRSTPTVDTLIKIATLFNISIDWLLGLK